MKKSLMLLAILATLNGCSKKGELGATCETAGSTDLCESGLICTNVSGSTFNACRKQCTSQSDCNAATESCNGVSGSSIKSCQPN